MCLCLFAINEHKKYPFVLLANRDEFRQRPTAKAEFWNDHSQVLAGRDLQEMGTWLGITRTGRISFLTNYRDPKWMRKEAPSRGKLVSDFLISRLEPQDYVKQIENPESYNGFNLMLGNYKNLFWYSNVKKSLEKVPEGIHGLSNAFLNTSWPKVDHGKEALKSALKHGSLEVDDLFEILSDPSEASDKKLPDTGIGEELERKLSSKFINTPPYGTVSSTVVLIDTNGNCTFTERSFDHEGRLADTANHNFKIS